MTSTQRTLATVLGLLVLLGGGWLLMAQGWLDAARLQERLAAAGVWAPAAFVAVFALQPPFLLPPFVLATTAGLLFGPLAGTGLLLVGAVLRTALFYALKQPIRAGRWADRLPASLGAWLAWAQTRPAVFTGVLRLVPVFPFDAVSVAVVVAGVPLGRALLGTAAGAFPGALAYALLGAAVVTPDHSRLLLLVLSALLLIGVVAWAQRRVSPFVAANTAHADAADPKEGRRRP